MTQADAARRWQVDVSTIIGIRRTVKDAALAALARTPGRAATQRDWQLEAARHEIDQLTEAVKAQAIDVALARAKPAGPERPAARSGAGGGQRNRPQAGRRAVAAGAPHTGATGLLGVSYDRVHRWRARLRDVGTLVDRPRAESPCTR